MKQKKLGDILYVFTDEPYEITEDTDASIVYVQAHSKEGFEALNPDLTFKKINYNVFTVKDPEWKEYLIAQDEESQEPSENPVTPDPTPTPTPVEFEPTTYSFVSFDPTGETEYATGKAQTTADTGNGRTKIQVTENSVEGFVGNYYWISSSAQAADDTLYPLYSTSDDNIGVGISVKIYAEGQIPSNADPVEPTPSESTEYNFISYDTTNNTEKQNGKFTLVPNTAIDGKIEITITEATEHDQSDMFWLEVGNSYWINDSYVADSNNIYDVYIEVNGSTPGIGIKVISIAE